MPVEPDQEQLEEIRAIATDPEDGPLVMLNLHRYKDRDAYARYGAVATKVLDRVGGRILWHAPVQGTTVGDDSDLYDDVIAVWYPSAAAFISLATDPEILEARADRIDGLERAALIRCDAASEPSLTAP
jgi:uncharacterized protein (DUF1330 family)